MEKMFSVLLIFTYISPQQHIFHFFTLPLAGSILQNIIIHPCLNMKKYTIFKKGSNEYILYNMISNLR